VEKPGLGIIVKNKKPPPFPQIPVHPHFLGTDPSNPFICEIKNKSLKYFIKLGLQSIF